MMNELKAIWRAYKAELKSIWLTYRAELRTAWLDELHAKARK
jgi:hypothetical protein